MQGNLPQDWQEGKGQFPEIGFPKAKLVSLHRTESRHQQYSKHFRRKCLTTLWMPQTAPNRLKTTNITSPFKDFGFESKMKFI